MDLLLHFKVNEGDENNINIQEYKLYGDVEIKSEKCLVDEGGEVVLTEFPVPEFKNCTLMKKGDEGFYEYKDYRQGENAELAGGYVSLKAMRLNEITDFVKQMSREFPWLHKCYKKFDVANIGVVHNLDIYLYEPYYEIDVDLEISNENVVDHNEDYKLVDVGDDLYELRNLDDEIISTSTFNNIEDALDEIDERNIGIEP